MEKVEVKSVEKRLKSAEKEIYEKRKQHVIKLIKIESNSDW